MATDDLSASDAFPLGFSARAGHIGLREDGDDFMVVMADAPVAAAGVFTQSHFAGPSVTLSRAVASGGSARAVAVVAKNANVANGTAGERDAAAVQSAVAQHVGCEPGDVFLASTGVIGVPYPMDVVDDFFDRFDIRTRPATVSACARAIMTTDTRPKVASASVGPARVVGFAKGVGMIEPNMATMIAVVVTDAAVSPSALDRVLRAAVDVSFNSLSIDTDTSTSDTAVVLASGQAGEVDEAELVAAMSDVCVDLARQIAGDGEGATTRIEVVVSGAADEDQARAVAKSVVNSPLVKTAVFGNDPNWGRIAMAVGKVADDRIDQRLVQISIGGAALYPTDRAVVALDEVSRSLDADVVEIGVDLGLGDAQWRVFGSDLSYDYVRINAEYTT